MKRLKRVLASIVLFPVILAIGITEITRINPEFDLILDTALAKLLLWCLRI